MNVATRDLCIELKKLTRWSGTDFCWNGDHLTPAYWPEDMRHTDLDTIPAYDLGYLLRKLPNYVELTTIGSGAIARYVTNKPHEVDANTPEDAACKLAIKLCKEGVLKK